jgi:hypothetical protein
MTFATTQFIACRLAGGSCPSHLAVVIRPLIIKDLNRLTMAAVKQAAPAAVTTSPAL